MFKTMEILLFWGLVSLTSAQFIIYGGNVPQRDPTQPFIIYGNNPQPSFSGGNPPPQPLISGGISPPGPPPPPQPFIAGGILPPSPPPQPFISGGGFPPSPPPPPFISGIIPQPAPLPSPPPQPILGGNPFQQVSDGSFSPNPSQQLTSVSLPPQQPIFGGSPPQSAQALVPATSGSNADGAFGDSEYHYSWLHDGNQKYNHDGAIRYCNGLGGGWRAVSIESLDESFFINVVINSHKKSYIWTAGVKDGSGWRWLNVGPLTYTNWSFTGGKGQPQPDDREGNENCLGILNNIYRDGIKWHDIACHHAKPIICERSAQKSSF